MVEVTPPEDRVQARIMLGLLDSVERNSATSQRRLAADLGIAVGLINAYLKRCIKKGLIKASQAPARRYAYYLTPQGFVEKARLTVDYLSYSFGFFREAKTDCSRLFQAARARGVRYVVLAGRSDLAEIAVFSAMEQSIEIVGVVQREPPHDRFVGLPVFPSFDQVPQTFDAILVTDLVEPRQTCEALLKRFGPDRVLIPDLLLIRMNNVAVAEGKEARK
jgi:hypothetical protein